MPPPDKANVILFKIMMLNLAKYFCLKFVLSYIPETSVDLNI